MQKSFSYEIFLFLLLISAALAAAQSKTSVRSAQVEDWLSYQSHQSEIRAKIEDKLGITFELQIPYVLEGESEAHLPLPNRDFFLLRSDSKTVYAVPLAIFEGATLLENGNHLVRLRSGLTIEGKLSGSLDREPGSATSGKYELKNVTSLKIIPSKASFSKASLAPAESWTVSYSGTRQVSQLLINPSFGFQFTDSYKQREGIFYEWATGRFSHMESMFKIRIGEEMFSANLPDFKEIVLTPGKVPRISVTAPSGKTTEGDLIFTRNGTPIVANNWYLIGIIPKTGGMIVIWEQPECSLKRNLP
jgi:hypothetical protein